MKHMIVLMLVITVALVVTGCAQQATPTATVPPTEVVEVVTIKVSGSGSITPVLAAISDEFHADNPGYVLDVLPGSNTVDAIRGTISGVLDLAAMGRSPRDAEAEQGIMFVQFGTSSTVVFAHPEAGVSELTSEQLTGLFDGSVTNWSEVGGADKAVIVYIRDPEESNTVQLRTAFIGEAPFAESAQLMNSQTDMQTAVKSIGGAIGYGTWAAVVANENDTAVVPLIIDGIGIDNPLQEVISVMGIGYLADNQEKVQPIIDWLLSENGQAALQSAGVVLVEG